MTTSTPPACAVAETKTEPVTVAKPVTVAEAMAEPVTVAEPMVKPASRKYLTVGSDCAGMCTELHALNVLGVPYKHAFASDIWEPAIRYIRANHRPCVMHHDMTQRALKAAPKCDLYLCSSPCQPVSVMNAKKKIDDKRREPLSHALDYIRAKQPKYWVFENVLGLMRVDKGSVWRSLCSQLDAHCVWNSCIHGATKSWIRANNQTCELATVETARVHLRSQRRHANKLAV